MLRLESQTDYAFKMVPRHFHQIFKRKEGPYLPSQFKRGLLREKRPFHGDLNLVKAKKIEKNCCSVEAAFTTDVESKICFSFAKKRRSLHTKRGSEADIVARFFRDLEALLIGAALEAVYKRPEEKDQW